MVEIYHGNINVNNVIYNEETNKYSLINFNYYKNN